MSSERPAGDVELPDFDLTDDELRATGAVKWVLPPRDVLPAWVAEMDVRPCPAVQRALHDALDRAAYGYPPPDAATGLPEATAAFLGRRFAWTVSPGQVVLTGDVMAGVRLVLDTVCERAPVVVPLPAYPPFLDMVPLTGRRLVTVASVASGGRPELDLDGIGAALGAGARTVLLSAPHNPLGRAFSAAELEALRDVVDRHRARVISDEIHGPLTLAGARHVPYLSLDGTARHATAIVASSKAWNTPGLKCAQIVAGSSHDRTALRSAPLVANHGTASLGITAALAAYADGEPWLDGLLEVLAARRRQLCALLSQRLPQVAWTPMEATYLAWLDAGSVGSADPASTALVRGRVMVHPGRVFGPGYARHVRLNLATSSERLGRIVDRLALAWSTPDAVDHGPGLI